VTARAPAPPGRPALPGIVAAAASALVVVGVFMPWYAPELAPPLTPDSVSGWDATLAAKIAVVGAVVCALCAVAVVLDGRDLIALDAGGVALLSGVAVAGALAAVAAVAFRTVLLPDPADVLSRQLGLYVALAAALAALAAAAVQLVITSADARGAAPPGARPRRR
jgi:hypothetical protein